MAQGIVTYDAGAGVFTKNLTGVAQPNNDFFYFEDFVGTNSGVLDATNTAEIFTLARIFSTADGSAETANISVGTGTCGELVFTPANGDVNLMTPKFKVDVDSGFAAMEVRLKKANSDKAEGFFVGFSESLVADNVTGTARVAAAAGKDRTGFMIDASTSANGKIDFFTSKDTSSNSGELGGDLFTAATYIRLGIVIEGNRVKYFVDGELKKTVEEASVSDQNLFPVIAAEDDESVVTVDYISVSCLR